MVVVCCCCSGFANLLVGHSLVGANTLNRIFLLFPAKQVINLCITLCLLHRKPGDKRKGVMQVELHYKRIINGDHSPFSVIFLFRTQSVGSCLSSTHVELT